MAYAAQYTPLRFARSVLYLHVMTSILNGCASPEPLASLPVISAEINATSVSGLSSGAYMAGQVQFAHSKIVVGAGIVAGGPYGCAESIYGAQLRGPGVPFINLSKAINGCMLNGMRLWDVPNPESLAERARQRAGDGEIDAIEHIRDDRVYIYSGQNDRTVLPEIVAATARFYKLSGVSNNHLAYLSDHAAGHAFVTTNHGLACGETGLPYITDCDYDQAGAILAHIYGELAPRSVEPQGHFQVFNQKEFTEGLPNHGMSDKGIFYLPRACTHRERCRIHVVFHGCSQNRDKVGNEFAERSGFAEWADNNRIVVLFPQTKVSPLNPKGCWDWWGYTGQVYLTKSAPQIVAIWRMLKRLSLTMPSG